MWRLLEKLYARHKGRDLNKDVMAYLRNELKLPPQFVMAVMDGMPNLVGINMKRALQAELGRPAILGFIDNIRKGIALWNLGKYEEAIPYLTPTAVGSIARAHLYRTRGIAVSPRDNIPVSLAHAIWRSLGFNVTEQAVAYYARHDPVRAEFLYQRRLAAYAMAKYDVTHKLAYKERAMEIIRKWNEKVPYAYRISTSDPDFRRLRKNEYSRLKGLRTRGVGKRFRASYEEKKRLLGGQRW